MTTMRVVGLIIALGGLLRMVAAFTLTPHVDEASSLLAAHAVAERGLPILPSGTVYMQGATLSFLLVPFIWLGHGQLADLSLVRMVVVVAGTLTIWLGYRLATTLCGSTRAGLVMAGLVAIDPLGIQWSGHLRMYGLLQPLTVGLALAWTLLLTHGSTRQRMAIVVLLFWAAVFTHIGAALLGPALFIAALIRYRQGIVRQGRVLVTLAISASGAGALMLLNRKLGSASVGDPDKESTSRSVSFVGDNLLALFANSIDELDWVALTRGGNLFWLIPGVLVAIATIAGGRHLLRSPLPVPRSGALVVLSMYWFPIVAVGLMTSSPKERYVLNSHLLGYLFVAVIVVQAIDYWREAHRGAIGMYPLFSRLFSMAVIVALLGGTAWRLQNPVVHPDHHAALEYVSTRHEPGEPVIVALPAIGYLALAPEDRDDLYFLAGEQDQSRARRYTRYTGDEKLIDYWVGVPAIVSPTQLITFLNQHPDAWIVLDRDRLSEDWAYGGVIEHALRESTIPVATTPGGGLILRPSRLPDIDNSRMWTLVTEEFP
jgi:hypothetical protein